MNTLNVKCKDLETNAAPKKCQEVAPTDENYARTSGKIVFIVQRSLSVEIISAKLRYDGVVSKTPLEKNAVVSRTVHTLAKP